VEIKNQKKSVYNKYFSVWARFEPVTLYGWVFPNWAKERFRNTEVWLV
jgi:hypothetical protein